MHSGATSTRRRRLRKTAYASAIFLSFAISAGAQVQVNVLTANYDNLRTNANLQETKLTPATVAPGTFGKLGTLPVDGQVYAQPLYFSSLSMPGYGARNVVYIATEHNSVYAYDADSLASPVLFWHVNLGPSVPSGVIQAGYNDVSPEVGILSTGTIDVSAGVLYIVAETLQNGAPVFQLHALSLTDGSEQMNGPVTVTAQYPGSGYGSDGTNVTFDPTMHIQRPGLLLANNTVYIAFGSHADFGGWHGWVIGYKSGDLSVQTGVFNTSPNGLGGSVWQSGRGLAADEAGALYFISGNGDFDGATGMGESMIKMSGTTFQPVDWYAPGNADWLSNGDYDLAAGVALIPGTHTAIGGDKYGDFYVVNGKSMGHQDANNTSQFNIGGGNFGLFTFAVWNRSNGAYVYTAQQWGPLQAFQVAGTSLNTSAVSTSKTTATTGYSGLAISANGGVVGSGIVWQTTRDTQGSTAGTLHAFDADDLTVELWNSNMASGDALGTFAKFVSPTVVNGKVYVPTFSGGVAVYGLLPSASATGGGLQAAIAGVENAASYASDAVSPGELVTLFGMNLGPPTPASLQLDSSGLVSTNLASTRVLFDGIPAPMIYAGANQVSAVVPYGLTNPTTQVQVEYQGATSSSFAMNVVAATPALFTANSSGAGQAAALNQDGSVNSSAHPAKAGSVIVLYATGGGATTPAEVDGAVIGTSNLPQPVLPVTVAINGQAAQVYYAGAAPGMVAGVLQINVQVPAGTQTGSAVPVTFTVGKHASPQSVSIAVQ